MWHTAKSRTSPRSIACATRSARRSVVHRGPHRWFYMHGLHLTLTMHLICRAIFASEAIHHSRSMNVRSINLDRDLNFNLAFPSCIVKQPRRVCSSRRMKTDLRVPDLVTACPERSKHKIDVFAWGGGSGQREHCMLSLLGER